MTNRNLSLERFSVCPRWPWAIREGPPPSRLPFIEHSLHHTTPRSLIRHIVVTSVPSARAAKHTGSHAPNAVRHGNASRARAPARASSPGCSLRPEAAWRAKAPAPAHADRVMTADSHLLPVDPVQTGSRLPRSARVTPSLNFSSTELREAIFHRSRAPPV
jgi:hypothetical protein